MARLDELAEGIAKVLSLTETPEPLPIDFMGEGPVETTVFVRALIDASQRLGAPLVRVCIDQDLALGLLSEHGPAYQEVVLEARAAFKNRIEIYRFSVD